MSQGIRTIPLGNRVQNHTKGCCWFNRRLVLLDQLPKSNTHDGTIETSAGRLGEKHNSHPILLINDLVNKHTCGVCVFGDWFKQPLPPQNLTGPGEVA